jgi:hypothetical protein
MIVLPENSNQSKLHDAYRKTAWINEIRFVHHSHKNDSRIADEEAERQDVLMRCFVKALAAKYHWRENEVEKALITFLKGLRYECLSNQ